MQEIVRLSIDKLKPNVYQPRLEFDVEKINELAQSIKENGMIQPIVVRQNQENYEIIAGERRYRACCLLNMEYVDCIIMDSNDLESAKLALVENVQRENLSAIEEAKAYVQILKMTNITQDELAKQMGKTQSTIANKIRLLNLPNEMQEAIINKVISERHGRLLLSVEPEKQNAIFKKIIDDNLTVKASEELVKTKKAKVNKPITKAVARSVKIALNTINQSLNMIKNAGIEIESEEKDFDNYYQVLIKIPKK